MELSRLKDCFPAEDIEWRLQSCGKNGNGFWGMALAYVTNRAIMNRLDEVCGPENWKNEFTSAPDGGVLCGLSIRIDGEWVTKWDGAENTNIEAVKGGLSGSMKRAAVQWGIGRYLYLLEESWVKADDKGRYRGQTKDREWFRWNPPELPKWALPEAVSKGERKSRFTKSQMEIMHKWADGTFTAEEQDSFRASIKGASDAELDGVIKGIDGEYNRRNKKVSEADNKGASEAFQGDIY